MKKYVYKVCSKFDWETAKKNNVFEGSGIDLIDKFIHFSSSEQVKETASLHFKKENNLVLLEVETKNLNILWEESRNQLLFPHLYDSLPINSVVNVYELPIDENGKHVFPKHIK